VLNYTLRESILQETIPEIKELITPVDPWIPYASTNFAIDGESPLYLACMQKNIHIVEAILSRGAKTEIVIQKLNNEGFNDAPIMQLLQKYGLYLPLFTIFLTNIIDLSLRRMDELKQLCNDFKSEELEQLLNDNNLKFSKKQLNKVFQISAINQQIETMKILLKNNAGRNHYYYPINNLHLLLRN
jgi:ankyrin repeat protein